MIPYSRAAAASWPAEADRPERLLPELALEHVQIPN